MKLRLLDRFSWLIKSVVALDLTWLCAVVVICVIYASGQYVTQAEHERLRADVQAADAQQKTDIAVLAKVQDIQAQQIRINTDRLANLERTANYAQAIGVAFGVLVSILNIAIWLSHKQMKDRLTEDERPSDPERKARKQ